MGDHDLTDKAGVPIDAVITWVDGNDQRHREKRQLYLRQEPAPEREDDIHERRWVASDEVRVCLKSIDRFAPWVRTIWIITDDQTPDLSWCKDTLAAKIRIVSHRAIYRGFEQYLPTFNSTAIETMMWRIEGLSRHFLHFNDDFFLMNPVQREDFFHQGRVVLRGVWKSFDSAGFERHLTKSSYRVAQRNAFSLLGFDHRCYFSPAHVVRAMDRDVMKRLVTADWFPLHEALAARFRTSRRVNITSLHAHYLLKQNDVIIRSACDTWHLKVEACRDGSPLLIALKLFLAKLTGVKLLCVNEAYTLEARSPRLWRLISRVAGG
jgi:hypothetical protein